MQIKEEENASLRQKNTAIPSKDYSDLI